MMSDWMNINRTSASEEIIKVSSSLYTTVLRYVAATTTNIQYETINPLNDVIA
ncbi:MAG: hypothetical protein H6598_01015 [Flavobacteriales bacterium]|nr:hypothetical protein [Flavobacteriales bacterium]